MEGGLHQENKVELGVIYADGSREGVVVEIRNW